MKTVTIPTCDNPFSAIVNGKKYTYEAGKTVGVPDEVAAVIQAHRNHHDSDACGDGSLFRTVTFYRSGITYIDENMQPGFIQYIDNDDNAEPIPVTVKIFGGVFVCCERCYADGVTDVPCDLYDTGSEDCYLHIAEDGAAVH